MKIIIESQGIKREVPLPAGICLGREAAYRLREAMNEFLGSDASYGWVTIHSDTHESAGSNTTPLTWKEGS